MIETKPCIPRNRISLGIAIQSQWFKNRMIVLILFKNSVLFFFFFWLASNKFPLPFYIAKCNIIHVHCFQRFFFLIIFRRNFICFEKWKKEKSIKFNFLWFSISYTVVNNFWKKLFFSFKIYFQHPYFIYFFHNSW